MSVRACRQTCVPVCHGTAVWLSLCLSPEESPMSQPVVCGHRVTVWDAMSFTSADQHCQLAVLMANLNTGSTVELKDPFACRNGWRCCGWSAGMSLVW